MALAVIPHPRDDTKDAVDMSFNDVTLPEIARGLQSLKVDNQELRSEVRAAMEKSVDHALFAVEINSLRGELAEMKANHRSDLLDARAELKSLGEKLSKVQFVAVTLLVIPLFIALVYGLARYMSGV